jgi:hypothetical protein
MRFKAQNQTHRRASKTTPIVQNQELRTARDPLRLGSGVAAL